MDSYRTVCAPGQGELVEKRSRFIGEVWRAESVEEARTRLDEVRKARYDARHHCWCYLLRNGEARYSDDGEPQGTAGVPMLNVFQREGVVDVFCVVTRYFGGILLGTGGLARAYGAAAKLALEDGGTCRMGLWDTWEVACPYPLFERVKLLVDGCGGVVEGTEYGADVSLRFTLPAERADGFLTQIREATAGRLSPQRAASGFRPGPREAR